MTHDETLVKVRDTLRKLAEAKDEEDSNQEADEEAMKLAVMVDLAEQVLDRLDTIVAKLDSLQGNTLPNK